MEKVLCTALFFTGVLLAACTRFAAPVYADAPARQTVVAPGGCYLALEADGSFVLHRVDPATRRDTMVASASGSPRPDGSRAARFFWGGQVLTARETADGRLAVLQA